MLVPARVNRVLTLDPFNGVQRDLDSLLGRVINGRTDGAPYAVDVRQDADHLYVEAELPGFKKEEVEITLEDQTLSITAERKVATTPETTGELLLNERRTTRFQRSFKLPPTIGDQNVNAKLEDGVLTVTLTKREESKPRKIAVN